MVLVGVRNGDAPLRRDWRLGGPGGSEEGGLRWRFLTRWRDDGGDDDDAQGCNEAGEKLYRDGGPPQEKGGQGRSRVRRKDVRLTRVLMLMDIPTT